ncbi:MAG: diflavin oxidoreductase [Opitutales bacterium]
MPTAPYIPETAPFTEDQRSWLNGFLAGLHTEAPAEGGAPANAAPATPVTLLFGSQTGTAETLAKKASKALKAARCEPQVVDMADASVDELAAGGHVLILTSTYGEGDPPDNAQALHEALMADGAPRLDGLHYAVLGLGDSSYPDFCQCSREFDARLEALGAERFAPTVECDGDPDEGYAEWLDSVKAVLGEAGAAAGAPAPSDPTDPGDEAEPEAPAYDKTNPFPAKLLKTENLNGEGSSKATHHVEFSLEGSGLSYEVGDALAVVPENDPRLVDEIVEAAGFATDEPTQLPDKSEAPLFDALRYHYDISVLTEPFLRACARLSRDGELRGIVADDAKLKAYLPGRGLIDPIVDYRIKFPTTEYLIAPLRQLKPRLYSIASSPRAHPGEVHLTVGKVSYDAHGRERLGVCSTYLAEHDGRHPVKVYLHPNQTFRLTDDDDAPVIMIGPGTGIAPFRAFLEEREARAAKGKNWLFFGDQHIATDFLYEAQIEGWMTSGLLSRLDTAFSRDQEAKVYVQDRILERAERFYQWLEEGATIYVCGDASRMARDVDAAIHEVVKNAGGQTDDEAKAYVDALKKAKRYLRDVY